MSDGSHHHRRSPVTRATNGSKRDRRAQARLERQRVRRRAVRRKKLRRLGGVLVSLAVVGAAGFAIARSSNTGVAFAGDIRTGGRIESLQLPELNGHGVVRYSAYRDRPLVINFFASWCPNCIGEMPGFQAVHRQLASRVAFLGISQSDSRGASIDLAQKTGITYPTAIDAHGTFFHATGSAGMPTTLFVQPGGRIAYINVGALDPTTLRRDIAQYFGVR